MDQNIPPIDRYKSLDQASLLTSETESEAVANKLRREAELFASGTAAGIIDSTADRINNPGKTAIHVGIAYGIGFGLSKLQAGAGIGRLTAEVVGLGLMTAAARDLWGRSSDLKEVWLDTWNNKHNFAKNKPIVAETVGTFVVDTALFTAAGIAGARSGHPRYELKHRIETNPDLQHGLVKFSLLGDRSGSGFAISNGRIVSANHVTDRGISTHDYVRTYAGEKVAVVPEISLPARDLVLYRVLNKAERAKVTPLRLADGSENLGKSPVAALGFGPDKADGSLFLRVAVDKKAVNKVDSIEESNKLIQIAVQEVFPVLRAADMRPGMSGGPLLNSQLDVIGVNQSGMRPPFGWLVRSKAVTVEDVKYLVALAEQQRGPNAARILSVQEAAQKLNLPEQKILDALKINKIEGFKTPVLQLPGETLGTRSIQASEFHNTLTPKLVTWEWRIFADKLSAPQ